MTVFTEWKTVHVADGGDMRVFVAHPSAGKKPSPSLLVLQEAFGVNNHIRDVAQRIAALGFMVVAPELFHRSAPPGFEVPYEDRETIMKHIQQVTEAGMEADLRASYNLLTGDLQADKAHIGAIGFCMGGRAAFIANSILPLACAVSYYGGGIADKLLPRAKDQYGPMMFFWGGKDAHIGPESHYATAKALREAGKTFIDVEFSAADHGFFCNERKSYHPEAAAESWALVTAFFDLNLKG